MNAIRSRTRFPSGARQVVVNNRHARLNRIPSGFFVVEIPPGSGAAPRPAPSATPVLSAGAPQRRAVRLPEAPMTVMLRTPSRSRSVTKTAAVTSRDCGVETRAVEAGGGSTTKR